MHRLGVVDRGETAVRVLNAVHGLVDDDGSSITTVLAHPGPEHLPWYGREADDVVILAGEHGDPTDAEIVAAMLHASVDTVWLGARPNRTALVAACEGAGLTVVGPSAGVLHTIADTGTRIGGLAGQMHGRRRVEVDVLADHHGTIWTLTGRDVSVHRGGRTLIAESPCPGVGEVVAARLRIAAIDFVRANGYTGAGTLTFVHDDRDVELTGIDPVAAPDHATTEERTGSSIIGWRLRIERGESLPGTEPVGEGVAMEAHLLAEDPASGFAPASGEIALLSFPVGTGVRIDANRRVGDVVGPDDPLLAVFTATGPDRATALDRLRRALVRTSVVIDGGATNRTLLLAILDHPEFRAGDVDDEWCERVLAGGLDPAPDPIALLAAAVEAYEADATVAQASFFAAAARGRPEQPEEVAGRIELAYRGTVYDLEVHHTGPRSWSIRSGDAVADLLVDRLDGFERRITCAGRRHRVLVSPTDSGFRVELGHAMHLVDRQDGVVVRAGWPALVVSALVTPGQRVAAGDPIAVLESMKMETTVTAPTAGVVTAVTITPNLQIEAGAPLIRLRAHDAPTPVAGAAAPPVVDLHGLDERIDTSRKPCLRVYEPLGNYVLGYDLSPAALKRLLVMQRRLAEIAEPADAALMSCEDGLLDIVADLGALYRPQTDVDPDAPTAPVENTQEHLVAFAQWLDADQAGLPESYRVRLRRALDRYGVGGLDRTPQLEAALMRMFRSLVRLDELSAVVLAILQRRLVHRHALSRICGPEQRARLDRLATATHGRQQAIADLARDVRFHLFDEPPMAAAAQELVAEMAAHFDRLAVEPDAPDRAARLGRLVWCPHPMRAEMLHQWRSAAGPGEQIGARQRLVLEVYVRRFYRIRQLTALGHYEAAGYRFATADYEHEGQDVHLVAGFLPMNELAQFAAAIASHLAEVDPQRLILVDLVTWRDGEMPEISATVERVGELASACRFGRRIHRLDVMVTSSEGSLEEHFRTQNVTFRQPGGDLGDAWVEEEIYRNLHPMLCKRLELWRLANFDLQRRPSPEDVYLFLGVARENPSDRRLFALAEIRELDPLEDAATGEVTYPRLERTGLLAMAAMRSELSTYTAADRPVANRLVLDITAPWTMPPAHVEALARRFQALAGRVGLEKVVLKVRIPDEAEEDGLRDAVLHLEGVGSSIIIREDRASNRPVRPLGAYQQKVLTAARFGSPYPYEIVRLLTMPSLQSHLPPDSFVELDLDDAGRLVPVDRAPGTNTAHLVVGIVTTHTDVVPEGIRRIALLSDPTQGLGNLAEPECRRVNAALELALERKLPVEWFAVSSGALIAMDSGTENMDWIALTLRRLIEFTQAGGEVNIIVTGINVGGQPYWNAEATMLMHTKGILVMTPASTMVLTGKQALDFSGAVSAEDNFGIGGYHRVMGPNGQAQYWARSFPEACAVLRRHYELTYVVPGERFPRRQPTADPVARDVRASVHAALTDSPFTTVGDVFSSELNPDRKLPFDMRSVMRSVADADVEPLERWRDLREGDTSIVWDTTVGGIPVCLLGIESHTVARTGFVPADGPPAWTSGTLFPHSSRKTARAINAASGNRPLVVLANLSGFDGSPESMRRRQLEFGAEIGRAVTNFDGPIVFVVVSRYHGGAFVVFSKALNEAMEIAAVEGSFASVIGGAPAAATVFAREVKQRTQKDPRVREATAQATTAAGADAAAARALLAKVTEQVRSEKLGEVADEFDAIHTIERALQVGSVDRIIPAAELRPYVVDALERGMARFTPPA